MLAKIQLIEFVYIIIIIIMYKYLIGRDVV